jgi:hypothetical protein
MPFRSDDADRAAVAPLLNELRGELLVLPREAVVEKHLGLMAFEQRVLTTPRVERPVRRVANRPRRTAFVFSSIAATIASCGLSAAGALPEPLQHITDTIAHTLGVPQSHDDGTSTGHAPTNTTPATDRPSVDTPSTEPATTPATQPARRTPRATTQGPSTTTPTVSTPTTEPGDEPTFPARPTDPPGRIDPTPPTTPTPPSNNSQNTPPGYPTDWREQAIAATSRQMWFCGVVDTLQPNGCPQSAVAPGAENVSWTLLGDPSKTSAAVATTTKNAAGDSSTSVTVYERFAMVASYTLPTTGDKQYLAYSSGIAKATMTWNGTGFDNATLKTGSVDGDVMPGVTVPLFAKPGFWDFVVSWRVQQAFDRCTATGAPDASCPAGGLLDSPSTNQSTLDGDVVSAAEVSFDGETGLYTVTGTYSLTPPAGAPVNGIYTATLFANGSNLSILSVTGH